MVSDIRSLSLSKGADSGPFRQAQRTIITYHLTTTDILTGSVKKSKRFFEKSLLPGSYSTTFSDRKSYYYTPILVFSGDCSRTGVRRGRRIRAFPLFLTERRPRRTPESNNHATSSPNLEYNMSTPGVLNHDNARNGHV